MYIKIRNFLTAFLAIAGLAACEVIELDSPANANDDTSGQVIFPSEIAPQDSMDMMTAISGSDQRIWAANGFTLAGFDGFSNCRLDDVMTMRNDGTYQYDSGQELCGGEDNQRMRAGRWELDFSQSLLIFDRGSNREYQAKIIGLKDGMLSVQSSYSGLEIRGRYATSN